MGGLEFVVIAVFFGLSAGVIAKIKGSSFWLWFLVGTVLPGLGTLGALLFRWERRGRPARGGGCGDRGGLRHPGRRRWGAAPAAPRQEPTPPTPARHAG